MTTSDQPHVAIDPATVQGLLDLARDLAGLDDLSSILERITKAITEVAEFECAALNMVLDSGDIKIVSVHGPPELSETLLGHVSPRAVWDEILSRGTKWGGVVFDGGGISEELFSVHWTSSDTEWFARTADDPRAWRAEYTLCAPMFDPDDQLVGIVSVDLPTSGLIPEATQLATLELLSQQAASAIVAGRAKARSELDEYVLSSLFEVSRSPLAICAPSGDFTWLNPSFRSAFGEAVDAATFDRHVATIESADDLDGLSAAVQDRFDGPVGDRVFTFSVGDGADAHWYEAVVRGVAFDGAAPSRVVCTFSDITAERRLQQQYEADATRDALTGLLNRRGFRRTATSLLDAMDHDHVVAVMFGDLDDFKLANDSHGHVHGDDVLIQVATRLRAVVPPDAVVARLGGDEFVVVATFDDETSAERVADAIVHHVVVDAPDRSGAPVRMSLGLAIDDPGTPHDLDSMIKRADRALYDAKVSARSQWIRAI